MSILIKGMEMPKNCGQCPFKKLSPTGESMICELTLFTVPLDWKTTDCPLVLVPEHGRLIDADALMENAEYKGSYDLVTAWDIVAAPTIIPASGGKENE